MDSKKVKTVGIGVWLIPTDGRKSFHRKAMALRLEGGGWVLRSYDTFVCLFVDGRLARLPVTFSDGCRSRSWSPTTGRHLRAFAEFVGLGDALDCKAKWDAMDVERDWEVVS